MLLVPLGKSKFRLTVCCQRKLKRREGYVIYLVACLSVRIDNSTFERVEEFKYLGTTLTNKNSIAEEIKSRLRSGNACYLSVQNLLSSKLLTKNLKIKIYRTIIWPVVLYGCEAW